MPPQSEKQSRQKILNVAKELGCEREIKQAFSKWETLLKNCTNIKEYQHMASLAVVEIHKILGAGTGHIEVNGQTVFDNRDEKNIKEIK